MNPETVISVLGPLTSNWQMRAWRLVLCRTELVAWPYTWKEGFRLGFLIELGLGSDPGSVLANGTRDDFRKALLGRDLREYDLNEITKIVVRSRMRSNLIEIHQVSRQIDCYGIMDRYLTNPYREILRKCYPSKYREEGFPTTILGRIIKY